MRYSEKFLRVGLDTHKHKVDVMKTGVKWREANQITRKAYNEAKVKLKAAGLKTSRNFPMHQKADAEAARDEMAKVAHPMTVEIAETFSIGF